MVKYDPNQDIFANEEFRALSKPQQSYALSQWNFARENRNLPRVDPPVGYFQYVTQRPKYNRPNTSILHAHAFPPARQAHNISPDVSSANSTPVRNIPVANSPSSSSISGGSPLVPGKRPIENVEPSEGDESPPSKVQTVGGSPSSQGASSSMGDESMDFSQNPQTPGGSIGSAPSPGRSESTLGNTGAHASLGSSVKSLPKPAAAAKKAGLASDGGFDNAQGPVTYLPATSYGTKPGSQCFEATHHIKGFANAMVPIAIEDNLYVTTPMNEIPWRYPFMYMSKGQFDLLQEQPGGRFTHCEVTITVINCATSYTTGSMNTQIASHNHPKIGMFGHDLERKYKGGLTTRLNLGTNLIPIEIQPTDWPEFVKYQWGTDQTSATWDADAIPGVSYPIIYHMYNNFTTLNLSKQGFDAIPNAKPVGHEFFAAGISQFNMNDYMFDSIHHESYTFSSAPIGSPYIALEIAAGAAAGQRCGNSQIHLLSRNVNCGLTDQSALSWAPNLASSADDYSTCGYYDLLEKGASNTHGMASCKPARQPTLHFGMKQIAKIDAGIGSARAGEFVIADVYYTVNCKLYYETGHYSNRFTQPKEYSVRIENAKGGVANPNNTPDGVVHFGLK